MRRIAFAILAVVVLAAWWITAPSALTASDLPEHEPDASAGERIFWAGGCAACHANGDDQLLLGGGLELESPYGTFVAPNISPHEEDGIGEWTGLEFVNAMLRGVSPDGRHYYPSFPYTSYARMAITDVLDLKAYLDTLQTVPGTAAGHDLGFPWSVRRGIGAWKRLYLDDAPVLEPGAEDPLVSNGRELVEGAGHCGECHTPRGRFGNLLTDKWLAGAPSPEGEGRVPNITPAGKTISSWSASDIEYYLESGFTPDFDTVGGTMVAVQENMARLTAADRKAIAAYLKAVPPVE
ncbi:MAG TPA: cytochrome c [Woeseiaceae bacterium]|nr:cytochrome c [Woeseiaceae bacterium]